MRKSFKAKMKLGGAHKKRHCKATEIAIVKALGYRCLKIDDTRQVRNIKNGGSTRKSEVNLKKKKNNIIRTYMLICNKKGAAYEKP
jgi:hypothetical protein